MCTFGHSGVTRQKKATGNIVTELQNPVYRCNDDDDIHDYDYDDGVQDRGDYHCNNSPDQMVLSFTSLMILLMLLLTLR